MRWSSKEKSFLKKFYARTSNNLLASVLGRSRSAVNHKGIDMSLEKKSFQNSYRVSGALKRDIYESEVARRRFL